MALIVKGKLDGSECKVFGANEQQRMMLSTAFPGTEMKRTSLLGSASHLVVDLPAPHVINRLATFGYKSSACTTSSGEASNRSLIWTLNYST